MTRRPCTGCGLIQCNGIECYLADPAETAEEGDTGITLDQLIETYGSQLTVVHSDPFFKREAA